jgi:hypothetical protein
MTRARSFLNEFSRFSSAMHFHESQRREISPTVACWPRKERQERERECHSASQSLSRGPQDNIEVYRKRETLFFHTEKFLHESSDKSLPYVSLSVRFRVSSVRTFASRKLAEAA